MNKTGLIKYSQETIDLLKKRGFKPFESEDFKGLGYKSYRKGFIELTFNPDNGNCAFKMHRPDDYVDWRFLTVMDSEFNE